MSLSEQDQIRSVAERIARRLSEDAPERAPAGADAGRSDEPGGELAALRTGLVEIQKRLAHIESHITHGEACDAAQGAGEMRHPPGEAEQGTRQQRAGAAPAATPTRLPWLSGTYVPVAHPSQEQFEIGEAVSELVDHFEREKICSMEPGGKPCDHCGMCSSRGF